MTHQIRDEAIKLGYIDARPITGHSFDSWRNYLKSIPLGQFLTFEHDPAKASGWPLDEITIWVAIASTPPVADWPDGCGEIGSLYLYSTPSKERQKAWGNAVIALGYEIAYDVFLPERAAAVRAGFGVQGLNGLLIAPDCGSFVEIALLLQHAAPPPGARGPEHDKPEECSKCGRCIDVCPTGAIKEDGVNTLTCLCTYIYQYLEMPEADYPKMGRRILGCDTCQLVCPCNAALIIKKPPSDLSDCLKLEELLEKPDIERMAKYKKLNEFDVKRQAILAAANSHRKDLLHLIEPCIRSKDEKLVKIAQWATTQLR